MTRDDRPDHPLHDPLHDPLQDALVTLFRNHGDGLAGAVRSILGPRADTQEILQEALLKAWKALRDGIAPAADRHRIAWLFVITMNLAKDQRRKEMRRHASQSIEEVNPMELRSTAPAPSTGLEQAETLAAARQAIHGLHTREKEVFLLRTSAGLSFDEAAVALGIPVGTAKTRMRSALTNLRSRLQNFAPTQRHTEPNRMGGQ